MNQDMVDAIANVVAEQFLVHSVEHLEEFKHCENAVCAACRACAVELAIHEHFAASGPVDELAHTDAQDWLELENLVESLLNTMAIAANDFQRKGPGYPELAQNMRENVSAGKVRLKELRRDA